MKATAVRRNDHTLIHARMVSFLVIPTAMKTFLDTNQILDFFLNFFLSWNMVNLIFVFVTWEVCGFNT